MSKRSTPGSSLVNGPEQVVSQPLDMRSLDSEAYLSMLLGDNLMFWKEMKDYVSLVDIICLCLASKELFSRVEPYFQLLKEQCEAQSSSDLFRQDASSVSPNSANYKLIGEQMVVIGAAVYKNFPNIFSNNSGFHTFHRLFLRIFQGVYPTSVQALWRHKDKDGNPARVLLNPPSFSLLPVFLWTIKTDICSQLNLKLPSSHDPEAIASSNSNSVANTYRQFELLRGPMKKEFSLSYYQTLTNRYVVKFHLLQPEDLKMTPYRFFKSCKSVSLRYPVENLLDAIMSSRTLTKLAPFHLKNGRFDAKKILSYYVSAANIGKSYCGPLNSSIVTALIKYLEYHSIECDYLESLLGPEQMFSFVWNTLTMDYWKDHASYAVKAILNPACLEQFEHQCGLSKNFVMSGSLTDIKAKTVIALLTYFIQDEMRSTDGYFSLFHLSPARSDTLQNEISVLQTQAKRKIQLTKTAFAVGNDLSSYAGLKDIQDRIHLLEEMYSLDSEDLSRAICGLLASGPKLYDLKESSIRVLKHTVPGLLLEAHPGTTDSNANNIDYESVVQDLLALFKTHRRLDRPQSPGYWLYEYNRLLQEHSNVDLKRYLSEKESYKFNVEHLKISPVTLERMEIMKPFLPLHSEKVQKEQESSITELSIPYPTYTDLVKSTKISFYKELETKLVRRSPNISQEEYQLVRKLYLAVLQVEKEEEARMGILFPIMAPFVCHNINQVMQQNEIWRERKYHIPTHKRAEIGDLPSHQYYKLFL